MMFDEHTGDYTLSSGRRFSSFSSAVGLGLDQGARVLVGGETIPLESGWTAAERAELADEMIRRWQAFKGAAVTAPSHDEQTADTM